jgi:tRNA(Ile)-lysidine synthetase-like protein
MLVCEDVTCDGDTVYDTIKVTIFTLLIIRHNRTEEDCRLVIDEIRKLKRSFSERIRYTEDIEIRLVDKFLVGSITASADIVQAKECLPRSGFKFEDGYLDKLCDKWNGNNIYDWKLDTAMWYANKDIQRMQSLVIQHTQYRPFFVSLSCGIDSTLLLFASTGLANFRGCVHINYKNRTTSDSEEELCRIMSSKLNMPLFVRQITELKRDDKEIDNRAFYERITKKMRFNAYKTALDSLGGCEKGKGIILLGHNSDDVTENIITNIKSSTHFDNLNGMEIESVESQYDVNIVRPFLEVSKKEITRIVCEMDVPFVWNSTPSWSMRGKLREKFIPFC